MFSATESLSPRKNLGGKTKMSEARSPVPCLTLQGDSCFCPHGRGRPCLFQAHGSELERLLQTQGPRGKGGCRAPEALPCLIPPVDTQP